MLFDCDALLGDARRRSVKYRFLSRYFNPTLIPAHYVREVCILCATEGFTEEQICTLMMWHPGFFRNHVEPLLSRDPIILADAERNAASITLQDGKDILMAIHKGSRFSRGEVPIWGAMWLHHQFHEGRKVKDIARELGVAPGTASRWASASGFQPVSTYGR